jgi:hypothetical protein
MRRKSRECITKAAFSIYYIFNLISTKTNIILLQITVTVCYYLDILCISVTAPKIFTLCTLLFIYTFFINSAFAATNVLFLKCTNGSETNKSNSKFQQTLSATLILSIICPTTQQTKNKRVRISDS